MMSFRGYRVAFVMLATLWAGTALFAQKENIPHASSPFAREALALPAPALLHGRQISAMPVPHPVATQTPQLRANPRYKTSGKEFYVVFLSSVSSDQQGTIPLRRVYVSSRAHVHGTISHVDGTWSQSFEVLPRSLTPVTLPSWASLDRLETEAAYRKVFKIEAEDEVAVYAISPNYLSSDGFLVLPKETLGKEYVVASVRNALWYNEGSLTPTFGGGPVPRSEFGIAAIEDGTEVTIRLAAESFSKRYQKGIDYKFTLDRGEVIQFMAHDTGRKAFVGYWDNLSGDYIQRISWVGKGIDSTDCDLTGSQVLATKPIAVFSGHERASIPDDYEFAWQDHPHVSRDHLIEQMPPLEVWGKRFFAIGASQNEAHTRPPGGDIIRVIARYNGTLLSVNGVFRDTLDEGEFTQFQSGDLADIEASQPVLVIKYLTTADPKLAPGMGDPDMTVVPPIENMSTFYTLPTIYLQSPSGSYFTEHYITLIIDTAAFATTKLNGFVPDSLAFQRIPNSPYAYARFRTQYDGEQRVESSLPCYAETYGYGDVDSYSFSGGGDFKYVKGLTANDLNFGFVKLGESRDSVTTVLSTIQPSPLADTLTVVGYSWESGDTNVFSLLDTIRSPIDLAPGRQLRVSFSFKPPYKGSFSARLRVWSSNLSPVYINVLGTSGIPCLQVDDNFIDFGRVRVNTSKLRTFTYWRSDDNIGAQLKLAEVNFPSQISTPPFFTLPHRSTTNIIAIGDVFKHEVSFTPVQPGFFHDSIRMTYGGSECDTPFVHLYGRGVKPKVESVDTNFGDVRYERPSSWLSIPIINKGTDYTTISKLMLASGDLTDFEVRAAPLGIRLDTAGSPQDTLYFEARFLPQYRPPSQPLLPNDVRTAVVMIVTEDNDTLYSTLSGRAVEPWFEASPITIDFGTIKNPLLSGPGQIKKKFALRNVGTTLGLLNALTIPAHSIGVDSVHYFSVENRTNETFAVAKEDSVEVTFFVKNVGVFRDSVIVENDNDARARPLVYLSASVEAEYDLNDTIYLDTVTDCLPLDTVIRIRNPYRIPILITDTAFVGNPDGFTFFPKVIVTPIVIDTGNYFDFTVRYEFPIDSVNGLQELLLIITKPVVLGGTLTSDDDTVHIVLFRRMQLLDLVAAKLPYNPNAKDAPFRLPIHIKGPRLGKTELDNITIYLRFSNKLVLPIGIDRTGSLTESTATNGVPQQPQWSWDEATSTMTVPIKGAMTSTDPTSNTLLFTLLGTTYLTEDTVVEITPEISYEQKPCAYRISRDSTTVVYANECGDRTIRDLLLRNPAFSLGRPYPDPASASETKSIFIPYIAPRSYAMQWKLFDELGAVCHTSKEQMIDKGMGTLTIDRQLVRVSGLYFLEVTVRDPDANVAGRYVAKFAVTD